MGEARGLTRLKNTVGWSLACSAVALAVALPAWTAQTDQPAFAVGQSERLLVVAPHPDDETLGAGGLVQRVRAQGGSVRIVLITAGDGYVEAVVHETGKPRPRPAEYIRYGERRLLEARAAARQLAPDGVRLQFLGFPDGGLGALLRAHWWRSRRERSATTHASDPPYTDALEPDCPYDGDDLRRELDTILREFQPTLIAFPDLHDVHPDHHATGVFTMLAVTDWLGDRGKAGTAAPRLLAYLIHWPNWPPGWQTPVPQTQADQAPLELPAQLQQEGPERLLTLTDQELTTKRVALAQHITQQEQTATLLAAFVRRTEPFTLVAYSQVQREVATIERHIPRTPSRHQHDTTRSPTPGA
jgi:LmbE family N-acetylglucosaminyl deacetylase